MGPHPLACRAAESLQRALREGALAGGVDLRSLDREGLGKMFGVLVVEAPSGEVGFLSGFSGKLDGRWEVDGFAPPLFDTTGRDAFWPDCEEEWRDFERQLAQVTGGNEAMDLRARREEQLARHTSEKAALHEAHARNRRLRQEERLRLAAAALEADERRRALHMLGQQSRADEVEQRALAARHRAEREVLVSAQRELDARRLELEQRRTERSRAVWQKIAESYLFPNARGEVRTLAELYAPEPPPGGAGDCAGPKLLAQAYRAGLRPLALAEFWWGAPPLTGNRHAGDYYPACRSKCGVVLPWMLQGL